MRVEESAPAISEFRLRQVERELGVTLPDDYRSFLLQHNGGRPVPSGVLLHFEGQPTPWRLHFFLGIDDPIESCSLAWNADITRATRPAGTIPIASDEAGNLFYLRWNEPNAGTVYFGATPSDGNRVHPVRISDSFTQFLEQLSEFEQL
jgi:hypothetical protein